MCGFIGIASKQKIDENKVSIENERIICRGPDETKIFKKEFNNLNIHLTFNRLSILELSQNGSQPIVDETNNYLMIFNGEIFNYIELKNYLKIYDNKFRSSNSDTEVLFYGLINEGKDFVNKIIGQFAFVFFDLIKNEVIMARDRTGQKPLFYCLVNDSLLTGSNLKSVSNLSGEKDIDITSFGEYLAQGVVTSPNTIYKNIFKLEPGSLATINLNEENLKIKKELYWNISDFVSEKNNFDPDHFNSLISNSIELRLRSDVPVATFCSGGLDSSLIIKKISNKGYNIPTYSVINQNPKYDESQYINQVIKTYSTDHTNDLIDETLNLSDLMKLNELFDEPYCDASNLPSSLISESISKKFKVAISGDGGDEIFFGYQRFQNYIKQKKLNNYFVDKMFHFYPSWLGTGNNINRFHNDINKSYLAYFEDTKLIELLNVGYESKLAKKYLNNGFNNIKNIMIFENRYYLSEMMNLKVDRTSMAHSLEVRSPFVDHRLIEYLLSCSTESLNFNEPKKFVKSQLREDFSQDFLNRKKMGFVFDLEGLIFKNKDSVKSYMYDSNLENIVPLNKIEKLYRNKSRINGLRLYKLLIISDYLK